MAKRIYKLLTLPQWEQFGRDGVFEGAPVDLEDGYIHFSTREQVEETSAKHFAGKGDLVLAVFAADTFGTDLKWESSRGGDLFPHVYASLDLKTLVEHYHLSQSENGTHVFPEQF